MSMSEFQSVRVSDTVTDCQCVTVSVSVLCDNHSCDMSVVCVLTVDSVTVV